MTFVSENELESYIRTLSRRRNLADSTVETKRSRLATYARLCRDVHGSADLVGRLDDLERTEIGWAAIGSNSLFDVVVSKLVFSCGCHSGSCRRSSAMETADSD